MDTKRRAGTVWSPVGMVFAALLATVLAIICSAGTGSRNGRVLPGIVQGSLTVFPVASDQVLDTSEFITLDEGIRSGQVIVTEKNESSPLIRRRPNSDPGPWSEMPYPPMNGRGAEVNRLELTNRSERPLILLAGEIVTGGKQDRVVATDRIVPAKSKPLPLDVFCVEPHRWEETSKNFESLGFAMAQPSVRQRAMAQKDQQAVWSDVARSRASMALAMPALADRLSRTSSYAISMQNGDVKKQLDTMVRPIEHSYDQLSKGMHAQHAVGAVVAINGEFIWADVFASAELFEKYWPKLIRSYAAESFSPRIRPADQWIKPTSQARAQEFLDDLSARREVTNSEPGVYRITELIGSNFRSFVLTSLLPEHAYNVHIAKMNNEPVTGPTRDK